MASGLCGNKEWILEGLRMGSAIFVFPDYYFGGGRVVFQTVTYDRTVVSVATLIQ